jgi:hypothetical protein
MAIKGKPRLRALIVNCNSTAALILLRAVETTIPTIAGHIHAGEEQSGFSRTDPAKLQV